MFKKAFVLVLLLASLTSARAQNSFSDEIITIGENEFMPCTRGIVLKDQEGGQLPMIEKICQPISSWDSLKPPKGFEARFYARGQILDLTFSAYLKEGGLKTVKSGALLSICVNDPVRAFGTPVIDNIFLQPEKVAEFWGYPVYQNTNQEITVISKSKSPLFVPVTQGEYLQQLIDTELKKQKNDAGGQRESNSDVIVAEMGKTYKVLLKSDPVAAAEFKIEIDKFKADMANDATENSSDDLVTALKKEFESLSPAERSKPARYSTDAFENYGNFSGLIPEIHATEGTALVKVAPEYARLANNKDAIKLLVIRWNLGNDNSTSDKPRLFDGEAKGFLLADYYMAKLYRQQEIWSNIIALIN